MDIDTPVATNDAEQEQVYPEHDATTNDVNLLATALNFAHNPSETPGRDVLRFSVRV